MSDDRSVFLRAGSVLCLLLLPLHAMAAPLCDVDNDGSESTACGGPDCDDDGDGHNAIVCGGDDCDDGDANRYPSNIEICDDGHDEDCNSVTVGLSDQDGDGFNSDQCCNDTYCPGRDCAPDDAQIHPIAPEVCNGIDDNCDGLVDPGLTIKVYGDADGDGYGQGSAETLCTLEVGFSLLSNDCDDEDPAVVPMAMFCGVDVGDVTICGADGIYVDATCGADQECVDQPNDYGVCVPVASDKDKDKDKSK